MRCDAFIHSSLLLSIKPKPNQPKPVTLTGGIAMPMTLPEQNASSVTESVPRGERKSSRLMGIGRRLVAGTNLAFQ